MFIRKAIGIVVVTMLVLCACSTGGTQSNVVIDNAWVRPALGQEAAVPLDATATAQPDSGMDHGAMGATGNMTAAYVTLRNTGGADVLLSVSSDVAAANEVHQTTMDNNIMRMQKIESLDIPANAEVEFKPGGYHIMLSGVHHDLDPGDTVTLRFQFKNSGLREVTATVREP